MRVRGQGRQSDGVGDSSVQRDWRAWLPGHKAEVYQAYVQELESAYLMFSVALNEALELRRTRKLAKSCQALYVVPALCHKLVQPLGGLLRALGTHARHYGTIANVAPLSPGNFQGARSQRSARMNDLLSRVLLTQRSQFLHKIAVIEEMIGELEEEFRAAAEEIGMGVSLTPEGDWKAVDIAHYDLNTCLRETMILLKSFLVTLPNAQLDSFQQTVKDQMRADEASDLSNRMIYLPAKRMATGGAR